MKKLAFTLAEIMIVLLVIAIITAILLPAARNAMPNENVMRFKKGHNALYSAISELVNSDKYYLDGDLGTKPDGTILESRNTKPEENQYFCQTFADVLSAKYVNCPVGELGRGLYLTSVDTTGLDWAGLYSKNGTEITPDILNEAKVALDDRCHESVQNGKITAKQFVAQNDVWYYDLSPKTQFGEYVPNYYLGIATDPTKKNRSYSAPSQYPPTFHDIHGMDTNYKIFCMDIDGVPDNIAETDCINECPFGYGIRADGKILNGARADEWLEKSIQDKD